jgi:hypothetical protein
MFIPSRDINFKNMGATKKTFEMTNYLACAIAEGFCEGEGATRDEQIQAWQYLHDTGLAYSLQGWYGRTAKQLIEEGIINDKKQ